MGIWWRCVRLFAVVLVPCSVCLLIAPFVRLWANTTSKMLIELLSVAETEHSHTKQQQFSEL